MELETSSLGASLLPWVKSFDSLGRDVEDWQSLSDGHALWAILQDLDPEYFSGSLPEPDVDANADWTRKWQNLKQVQKQISTYYRDVCNGQDAAGSAYAPDLQAIASNSTQRDLEKLIMIIIRAAMASPDCNQRMAQRLMGLGRENALVIATELRNMEETEYAAQESPSRDDSPYVSEQELPETKSNGNKRSSIDGYGDPLLEREEELLQAQATIDKLQATQAAAQTQIQELRQDKEKLQEAFDAYHSEISSKGRKPVTGNDNILKLQRQAENDRAYIDDLETQMQSSRNTIETYELQLERHRAENESVQKLRDDIQMLRAENEDLNQKIKANENLKKKIQTLQEQEKANAAMRDELKTANEKLEDLDRMRQLQSSLEKEIIEKKGLIRNQEYQINELTTTRKHAEYECRVLAQKLEAAKERHERDHEAIQELRAKTGDLSVDETEIEDLSPPPQTQGGTTDQESERKVVPKSSETKHLTEKLKLLEQQLEAADARLKQAAQRNAALEEQGRSREAKSSAAAQNEKTIAELRKELEAAKSKASAAAPASEPAAPPPDITVLQRENRLMVSAWYDLSTRIQHNTVSVARRKQDPRSWIGKQRALVGPGSAMAARN
ncbi:protein hook like 1 [Acrodontium crateriforme]|uniref:Protein hook like 1 n=1 Tax=Acrodontium crateriforme TaxID=150365 RepID=A0AAQ3MBA6_9PEZI|nr:protein hook like 1 [Acrodontium crateriforme]